MTGMVSSGSVLADGKKWSHPRLHVHQERMVCGRQAAAALHCPGRTVGPETRFAATAMPDSTVLSRLKQQGSPEGTWTPVETRTSPFHKGELQGCWGNVPACHYHHPPHPSVLVRGPRHQWTAAHTSTEDPSRIHLLARTAAWSCSGDENSRSGQELKREIRKK